MAGGSVSEALVVRIKEGNREDGIRVSGGGDGSRRRPVLEGGGGRFGKVAAKCFLRVRFLFSVCRTRKIDGIQIPLKIFNFEPMTKSPLNFCI